MTKCAFLACAVLAAASRLAAAPADGTVSFLETVDVRTGERTLVRAFDRRVEAPNWTRDGRYLIYNSDGRLWRVPVAGGAVEPVDTGFCTKCNNDHVLSFDGKSIAVSHDERGWGQSQVFVIPLDGGAKPRLVTPETRCYLHGWSPDGRSFAYCAMREADPQGDVYAISSDGGAERRLTTAAGLDDGPEYSPDGRHIWFCSVRSGLMQVWRMNADGSEQVRMTREEERNCWFPHVSPDGRQVVYIAYRKGDLEPGQHLPDKHVELRLMPAAGGASKTLVRLFGGQGSINVNSWSPDSTKVAFVSYRKSSVAVAASDTWAAEDALGRRVGSYGPRAGKREVLLFYWTWHDDPDRPDCTVKNITEIVRDNPGALGDGELPCWKRGLSNNRYFWDEPLFGYYKTWDTWVLRRHAEMLASVGVDAVFFDCTNGSITWDRSTEALMETWERARLEGVAVPKIGFMLPFGPGENTNVSLRRLYENIYRPGRFPALWYRRDGKPCIMAYPDSLTDSETDRAIRAFFAFRPGQPDYVNGPSRGDQWGWLENYPQHPYGRASDGRPELVTVGVSQNACPETGGHCSAFNKPGAQTRSFTKRNGFDARPDACLRGANFLEQWDRAYELDPEAVFVTGWNEWTAGMWYRKDGWTGDPFSFVDEFDADHSRDLEPVKGWGEKGDVYYLQFADRVRKFKGSSALPAPSAPKTVRLGARADWDDVSPLYLDMRGDTRPRSCAGYCEKFYRDASGRNDIVSAKVARDGETVWFAVSAAADLTPASGRAWMTLFIDADRSKKTGWQGYDLVVNRVSPSDGTAVVERADGADWAWRPVCRAAFDVDGDRLVLALPRSLFAKGALDFEFKWGDNLRLAGDVMDFYVSGDTAPVGRFNYVFSERVSE